MALSLPFLAGESSEMPIPVERGAWVLKPKGKLKLVSGVCLLPMRSSEWVPLECLCIM